MKTKLLKLIFLLAIFTVTFSSCKNEYLPDEKAIVGKWKLISQGYIENNMISVKSDGAYVEFFPDGTRSYYNPATKKLQITGNFQIQSELLIYNYDKSIEQGRSEFNCAFSHNYNQLKLTYVNGIRADILDVNINPNIIIYQRIK